MNVGPFCGSVGNMSNLPQNPPRYLQFFVDLTNFSAEFANGPTFIRSVIEFSINLIWRVFTCDLCGREQTLRCVQFFLPVVLLLCKVSSRWSVSVLNSTASRCVDRYGGRPRIMFDST